MVWALNFSIVKTTLDQIDPMSFNAFRFILAIAVLLAVLRRSGQKLKVHKGDWPMILFLGMLGNLTYQVLFIFGINFTFSANAAVMLGTIPLWIGVVGHFFFDQPLNRYKTAGVVAAFTGVILIMAGSETGISLDSESILGDVIILAAAFVFGVYTLFSKRMLSRYTPVQLTTLMMLTGGTALVIAAIPWLLVLDYQSVTPAGWGGVIYSGVLSIGAAYVVWNYGLRQVGPVRTATYQNLVPVFGLIFGFLILSEKLAIIQYLGSLFVIAGIVLARRNPTAKPISPAVSSGNA